MESEFRRIVQATWSDMDFNRHMGNAAYLNLCTSVRLMHFAEQGLAMADFERLHVGPVVFRDEVDYFREVRLLENLSVTLSLLASSEDGSHFKLRNEIWKANDVKAATITSTLGWMDVTIRKLVVPPESIKQALFSLPRIPDFEMLQSLIKKPAL